MRIIARLYSAYRHQHAACGSVGIIHLGDEMIDLNSIETQAGDLLKALDLPTDEKISSPKKK